MLEWKIDVLEELKKAGYSTYRLQKENIIASRTINRIKHGEITGSQTLDTVCGLLKKQPGSLIKWIPDVETEGQPEQ